MLHWRSVHITFESSSDRTGSTELGAFWSSAKLREQTGAEFEGTYYSTAGTSVSAVVQCFIVLSLSCLFCVISA